MAQIFITGSADGLGLLAAQMLIGEGHSVVLHARNQERARQAMARAQGAASVLIADLSDIAATKKLAAELNRLPAFDAIIHNAGVYQASARQIFTVNTLAPYILTSLVQKPQRLIYLSSAMHLQGDASLTHFREGKINYSDSKLHVLLLAFAVARIWPGVYANAVNPGWVPTKMGGAGAPDDLQAGAATQSWLAGSNDAGAKVSGKYFHHKRPAHYLPAADDVKVQDAFLKACAEVTGILLPG